MEYLFDPRQGIRARRKLNHFAYRFPTNARGNGARVDLLLVENPAQYLHRTEHASLELDSNFLLRVMIDIDDYIQQHHLQQQEIDKAIAEMDHSSHPEGSLPFYALAVEVYDFLRKEWLEEELEEALFS